MKEHFSVHLICKQEWLDELLENFLKTYKKDGFELLLVSKPYPDNIFKDHIRIDARFTHPS